jgi:hypothetical protein
MLLSRVYVMKFEVCQQCFGTAQNSANTTRTLLPKHGTITQITPDIPQSSLHKHGTITQITPDTPQTSLHKHGQ